MEQQQPEQPKYQEIYQQTKNHLKQCGEDFKKNIHQKGYPLLIFYGPTGSGKSSLIAYLLGLNLIDEQNGRDTHLKYTNFSENNPKIGNEANSCTSVPGVFKRNQFYFIDLPGEGDNRGKYFELTNTIMISKLLEKGVSIIPVIVIQQSLIKNARGGDFIEHIKKYLSQFQTDDQQKIIQSCNLIISKVFLKKTNIQQVRKDIQKKLSSIIKQFQDQNKIETSLLQSVIRNKKLGLFLQNQDRKQYIEYIQTNIKSTQVVKLKNNIKWKITNEIEVEIIGYQNQISNEIFKIIQEIKLQIKQKYEPSKFQQIEDIKKNLEALKQLKRFIQNKNDRLSFEQNQQMNIKLFITQKLNENSLRYNKVVNLFKYKKFYGKFLNKKKEKQDKYCQQINKQINSCIELLEISLQKQNKIQGRIQKQVKKKIQELQLNKPSSEMELIKQIFYRELAAQGVQGMQAVVRHGLKHLYQKNQNSNQKQNYPITGAINDSNKQNSDSNRKIDNPSSST